MIGHVSIVGAGPGDPELLTRKAVARLRTADLVLYDALVDPRVLGFAKNAHRFFVGKRAGRHAMSQPAIHALMIRAARKGKRRTNERGGCRGVLRRNGPEDLYSRVAAIHCRANCDYQGADYRGPKGSRFHSSVRLRGRRFRFRS